MVSSKQSKSYHYVCVNGPSNFLAVLTLAKSSHLLSHVFCRRSVCPIGICRSVLTIITCVRVCVSVCGCVLWLMTHDSWLIDSLLIYNDPLKLLSIHEPLNHLRLMRHSVFAKVMIIKLNKRAANLSCDHGNSVHQRR